RQSQLIIQVATALSQSVKHSHKRDQTDDHREGDNQGSTCLPVSTRRNSHGDCGKSQREGIKSEHSPSMSEPKIQEPVMHMSAVWRKDRPFLQRPSGDGK